MSTIITRNSANSGSVPSSLVQGELAINVTDGRLFYGSGSGNAVKEFGVTASYALQALSSSYAETASYAPDYLPLTGGTISGTLYQLGTFYPDQIDWFSSSIGYDTGSYILTTTINGLTTYANYQDVANTLAPYIPTVSSSISASYAGTASYAPAYLPLTGGTINGNVTVNGTASIAFLNVSYESASIIYSSGSNQFGDALNDTQTLWGTVDIKTGPVLVTGSLNVSGGITGSLFGTASYAETALSSSFASTASYVQNAQTASYVLQAVSASFASTASYVVTAQTASFVTASNVYGPFGSNSVISASYAATASYATTTSDILVLVKNQSGNTIAKGVVVRITGSNTSSDIPRIVTASYENDNNSANTLGITNQSIANGDDGYVMTEGILLGIDTNAFISGQLIYLGATGSIIGYAPQAPLHAVRLGEVIRHQSNNGSIYVRIDNGYELEELHDVLISSASSGDLLIRSGSVWVNSKQLSGSYAVTGSLTSTSFTGSLLGTATTASYVLNAVSSSFASTASYVQNAQTASYVLQAVSASFATLAQTANTASYVVTAQTASYVLNAVSTSYASNALSSSFASTASYVQTAQTASYVLQAVSSSYASTISISNDVNDRVITANGNGTLNGEGNLTFNGQTLSVLYGVGDEGGEMLLGKPATNTTLTGSGVTVDVYQNKLRFFEQGGAARGFYLDITTGGGGASTNLASGGGTVTSVDTAGYVNGITLTGGPITGAGTITLGGTLSNVQSSQLATSSLMIGTTNIALGATASSLTGLTSINSTSFTGSLLGTATTASYVLQAVSASFASTASYVNTLNQIVRVGTDIELDNQIGAIVANSFDAGLGTISIDGTVPGGLIDINASTIVIDGNIGDITATTFTGTASYATQALSASYAPGVSKIIAGTNISISPTLGTGDVTINATAASPFPYTGSAIVSGSLIVTGSLLITGSATLVNEGPTILSGSFNVQGNGSGFSGPFTAITVDDVSFTRKLHDSQTGSGSLDFGTRDLLDGTGNGVFNWNGIAKTIDSRLYLNETISGTTRNALITNIGYGGFALNDSEFDIAVQSNDLVFLDTDGIWYQVDQTTVSSTKMLGICQGFDPMTNIGTVITEGDIVVTTGTGYPLVQSANYGLPVYIRESGGTLMSTVIPTTGYVRLLGHCYHNAGGTEWIMKFRPSHEWIEL